ncbi:SLC13 family permease [Methyloligella sp. 2.7D]|uniref:SLC13 family permease n=1 Tax=unclassified Methyloligella TaxID=2625955 RepID=UPI00157E02FF|nr:SLC13 family permease [Methyloligella sp. GL2]QKP76652.1 SLC13 family permease [Methyloligella sp. GL2]
MTSPQIVLLLLLVGLLVLFALDRFRIELVALGGLAAALLLGLVPFGSAFGGFANPAVITLAELLILTRVLSRSHLMQGLTRRLAAIAQTERQVLILVCGLGALTSVFINNIGALALWLPVALVLCRSAGTTPARILMPLSFATLLGGTCSVIGTPANLVVSNFEQSATGQPLGFFDIAIAGLPATLIGLAFLVLAAPKLLGHGGGSKEQAPERTRRFVTELRIPAGSSLKGSPVSMMGDWLEGEVFGHIRDGRRIFAKPGEALLESGDILIVEAPSSEIERLSGDGEVEIAGTDIARGAGYTEAIVLPQSMIVGSTANTIEAFLSRDIEIIALSTRQQRIEGRLADLQIRPSDILLLRGEPDAIAAALDETDCLSLAPQSFGPGETQGWLALSVFAAAVALAAANLLPPQIAFGGAVLVLALAGAADLRNLVADLNWPILLMLAAMIPIGEAVATTGLANASAEAVIGFVGPNHPTVLLACMLFCAVALTPFVNNVSSAIALAPIAIAVAEGAGLAPEPYLLAIAVGVSLDFLAPFGHHNNALVMSVAGYRFTTFPRLGLPLVLLSGGAAILALHLAFF